MFEGFELETVAISDGQIRLRRGGSGPPLLLLHGHPRTHTTWHLVAPILAAAGFTVICLDLPGFGGSFQPADHAGSSKRAKARALAELMSRLGHRRFAVVGHDRGSYTAFRLAMDNPGRVAALAVLDGVPILEALERCTENFARAWWHWFFFAVPEKPERAILADPQAWYGGSPEAMGRENFADFQAAIRDPAVVHGMVEDYRVSLTLDRADDAADRAAGRRLACPTLCLWSKRDDLELLYGDPLAIWKPWTGSLEGGAIDSGHHMAEEAPDELARRLLAFFRAVASWP
ncbi:alpha/beta fold hydrolase [Aurantimonas sp. VKM B-3413]|uniref:alpha/beta fold hydrolase n=1 Tax=Aurantimonas sp. VKM B-3413 TaxID=2779401 RepID=UPI001E57D726|nr:alpha/beta hydrolase [Aurantimonas sp. VKM B-3413]MCB8839210.1 alpha/beta hydrolase [Aurantimonas sp. VKM B-3413]